MAIFAVVSADDDGEIFCYGSCKADSPEAALGQFVDPMIGYVPEHMDNTIGDMKELTNEEVTAYGDSEHPLHEQVREKVKQEALHRAKHRFGLCACNDREGHHKTWRLFEFNTDTGDVISRP